MAKARLRWLVLPYLHDPDLAPRAWAQTLLDSPALAGFQPDLVFATAVAHSDAPDAYRRADHFAQRLLHGLGLGDGQLFVCPGPADHRVGDLGPALTALAALAPAQTFVPAMLATLLQPLTGYDDFVALRAQADRLTAARPFGSRETTRQFIATRVTSLCTGWFPQAVKVGGPAVTGHGRALAAERPPLTVLLAHAGPDAWGDDPQPDLLGATDVTLCAHGDGPGLTLAGAGHGLAVEVYDDRLRAQAFDPTTGALVGAAATHPLARPLPAEHTPIAGLDVPDLDGWLRHIERDWGTVALLGVAERGDGVDRQPVGQIYVSLRTGAPQPGAPDREALVDGDQAKARFEQYQAADDGPARRAAVEAAARLWLADGAEPAVDAALARLASLKPDSPDDFRAAITTWELEQAVAAHPHLLMEGAPGSGKTTTLQAVAAALALAHRGEPAAARAFGFEAPWPIPVVVPFRRYWRWRLDERRPDATAEREHFRAYLAAHVAGHSGGDAWIEPALTAGRVALLLDGLDELPDAGARKRAVQAVDGLLDAYGACRWIVTSRPSGLDPFAREALRRGFAHHPVRPLQPDQVADFLGRWFTRLLPPDEAEQRANTLLEELRKRGELEPPNGLGVVPVTLVAAALVGAKQRLPEHRAALYDLVVSMLVHQWDWQRTEAQEWLAGSLSESDKREVLETVAMQALVEGDEEIPRAALQQAVHDVLPESERPRRPEGCDVVIDHLAERSGLLLATGRHFRFRHRTFLEFLAGRGLVNQHAKPGEALAGHLENPTWQEAIRLAVGFVAYARHKSLAYDALATLTQAAARLEGPAAVQAWSVVAQAARDAQGHGVKAVPELMAGHRQTWADLLEDPATYGSLEARIDLGEALGHFGDVRMGWTEQQFPLVEAGPFVLGAVDKKVWPWELDRDDTAHTDAFRIGRYLVTIGQFLEFAGSPAWGDAGFWRAGGFDKRGEFPAKLLAQRPPNLPVTHVSWYEAKAFCAWATHAYPLADGWTYDLPTKQQWVKAARGAEPRLYPWGKDSPTPRHANFGETKTEGPTPVGLFPLDRGAEGLLDQAGNVAEWSLSDFTKEDAAKVDAWAKLEPGTYPAGGVLRGGAFVSVPLFLRVSFRDGGHPAGRYVFVGFRCVAVPRAGALGP